MFGVTASLLERSGAYQDFADSIQKNPTSSVELAESLDPTSIPRTHDPFGVTGGYRLSLRLVGALWSYGALSISGLHNLGAELTSREIIERSVASVKDAVEFLKSRLRKEITHNELENLIDEITDKFIAVLELKRSPPVASAFAAKHPEIIATEASRLTLDYILRLDSDNRRADGNIDTRHYREGGRASIQNYCLILWGTWWLQVAWNELRKPDRAMTLRYHDTAGPEDQAWRRAAMRLLIMSDEAGKGMGFSQHPNQVKAEQKPSAAADGSLLPTQAGLRCPEIWNAFLRDFDATEKAKRIAALETETPSFRFPRTLTRSFDDGLGAVLPKARTPGNGCTIRSFSHNLALLPPKGRIRARWARQSRPNDRMAYNVLLVPFPYVIRSVDVEPMLENQLDDWGFFRVRPGWIEPVADRDDKGFENDEAPKRRNALVEFLISLLSDQAENTINAVVLPEGALDWTSFDLVQRALLKFRPQLEMFVCGLNSACLNDSSEPKEGNFVATYMRACDAYDEDGNPVWQTVDIRAKHHRWRIDKEQLRSYALSHRLSPDKLWWENIDLPPREMLFAEFSSGSIVTTLVCEDLARIEPCQVALRAIGPNLIFVLLMDSAQIVGRWPYQYASVLADDPGSSILTLTSFGLVKRSNLSEDRDSREIAIWREPHGGPARAIKLPKGYHAQLVSLRREFCHERTLDGRGDNHDSALVWKFAGLVPIKSTVAPPGGGPDD